MSAQVRVVLPAHLRSLLGVEGELSLVVEAAAPAGARDGSCAAAGGGVTQRAVLDALEARYPALLGTVRDRHTKVRRPYIRFFACREDLSHQAPDDPLPAEVAEGAEPFIVLGAIAGG